MPILSDLSVEFFIANSLPNAIVVHAREQNLTGAALLSLVCPFKQLAVSALIIQPFGQHAISWFAIAALLAALIMVRLGAWYKARLQYAVKHPRKARSSTSVEQIGRAHV